MHEKLLGYQSCNLKAIKLWRNHKVGCKTNSQTLAVKHRNRRKQVVLRFLSTSIWKLVVRIYSGYWGLDNSCQLHAESRKQKADSR